MYAELETRLRDKVPALRLVEGAAALAALKSAPTVVPAGYVFPVADTGSPNAVANGISQRVRVRFGAMVVHGNRRDGRGEAASQELHALDDDVIDAFLGWVPLAGYDPITFAKSQTLPRFVGGLVWRLHEFETVHYIRANEEE